MNIPHAKNLLTILILITCFSRSLLYAQKKGSIEIVVEYQSRLVRDVEIEIIDTENSVDLIHTSNCDKFVIIDLQKTQIPSTANLKVNLSINGISAGKYTIASNDGCWSSGSTCKKRYDLSPYVNNGTIPKRQVESMWCDDSAGKNSNANEDLVQKLNDAIKEKNDLVNEHNARIEQYEEEIESFQQDNDRLRQDSVHQSISIESLRAQKDDEIRKREQTEQEKNGLIKDRAKLKNDRNIEGVARLKYNTTIDWYHQNPSGSIVSPINGQYISNLKVTSQIIPQATVAQNLYGNFFLLVGGMKTKYQVNPNTGDKSSGQNFVLIQKIPVTFNENNSFVPSDNVKCPIEEGLQYLTKEERPLKEDVNTIYMLLVFKSFDGSIASIAAATGMACRYQKQNNLYKPKCNCGCENESENDPCPCNNTLSIPLTNNKKKRWFTYKTPLFADWVESVNLKELMTND